jgi:hypothetical protein
MRVNAEDWLTRWLDLTVIQEHERFDYFADVRGTDEAYDGTVLMAVSMKRDATRAGGHGSLLRECGIHALTLNGGDG